MHVRVQSSTTNYNKASSGEDELVVEGDDDNGGGPLTAIEALKESCLTLSNQCDLVLEKLMGAAPEVKVDRERMDRLAEEDRMNEEEEEEEEEDMDEE